MRFTGMYLFGFAMLAAAIMLALWKLGVLAMLGTFWTTIVLLTVVGVGIMLGVMNAAARRTIEIDRR